MSVTTQNGLNVYTQGFGSAPLNGLGIIPVLSQTSPTSVNVQGSFSTYRLGQVWVNSVANAAYILTGKTSSQGSVTTTWSPISMTGVSVSATSATGYTQNAYVCNNASQTTVSLPASSNVGEQFIVTGSNANTGGFLISQGAGQQILSTTNHSTTGATGSISTAAANTSVVLMCTAQNTTWIVLASTGTVTYT